MTTESQWNEATEGAAANEEWREVESEDQIVMETVGDGFTGRLIRIDPPNANGIVQGHWTNVEALNGEPIGEACFMNITRDLQNKLRRVPIKAFTRIQWVDNLDTGHESGQKMRVFKVQWR